MRLLHDIFKYMIQYVCANFYAKRYAIVNKLIKKLIRNYVNKTLYLCRKTLIYLTQYMFKDRFPDFIFSLSIENFKDCLYKIRELLN